MIFNDIFVQGPRCLEAGVALSEQKIIQGGRSGSNSDFLGLSDLIIQKAMDSANQSDRLPGIDSIAVEEGVEYPISLNQSQLLTIYALDESSTAYNEPPIALWIIGSTSVNMFRSAVRSVLLRHQIFLLLIF